jgi:polyketide cyclase/dehydrase/lipid transport protein
MIQFKVTREIHARPAEVYAWLSDYSNADYSGPNWPTNEGMKRVVKEQDEQHAVFSDYYSRAELEYRAQKHPPTGIEARGTGKSLDGQVSETISLAGDGSKVIIDFRFEPKGVGRIFGGLMGGQVERATIRHVDCFIKDFYSARDSARGGAAGTPASG